MAHCKSCGKTWWCREDISNPPLYNICNCGLKARIKEIRHEDGHISLYDEDGLAHNNEGYEDEKPFRKWPENSPAGLDFENGKCPDCDGLFDENDKRFTDPPQPSDCSICTCPDCRAKKKEDELKERGEASPQPYITYIAKRYVCPYCRYSMTVPFEGKCPDCKRKLAGHGTEKDGEDKVMWRV